MNRFRLRRCAPVVVASLLAALVVPLASFGVVGDAGSGSFRAFATVKSPEGRTLVLFTYGRMLEVPLQGLAAGERVVGLDVRPANNRLYGLSSAGRVFAIDFRSGQTSGHQNLTVPLSGQAFGVDFNPSVDRLRITSDADQNLRVNVDTGATTSDPALAYAGGDRNAGKDPAVAGVAYTFAAFGSPTTLYDTDANADSFLLQNPPNAGTLNSIGAVGVDLGNQTGFDIAGTDTFVPYALFQQGGAATLYQLDFNRNGRATSTGLSLPGQYDGLAVLDAYGDPFGG